MREIMFGNGIIIANSIILLLILYNFLSRESVTIRCIESYIVVVLIFFVTSLLTYLYTLLVYNDHYKEYAKNLMDLYKFQNELDNRQAVLDNIYNQIEKVK